MNNDNVDQLAVRLATNDANMIGSLNLQVARLQQENIELKEKNKVQENLIAELRHQNELEKGGDKSDKRPINITGQQDKH